MIFIILLTMFFSPILSAGEFKTVQPSSPELAFVEKVFQTTIEPLYGDQSSALKKISDSRDRTCELYVEQGVPVGLLVYKNHTVQEFAHLGARDSLEIKSLFVIDAKHNSGKGTGSALIERVKEVARQLHARTLVVTVSEHKPESLSFFLKKGFRIIHTYHGKYLPGVDEYLLTKEV